MILAVYVALNIFPVRFYGEFEFWFSLIKVLLIVSLPSAAYYINSAG